MPSLLQSDMTADTHPPMTEEPEQLKNSEAPKNPNEVVEETMKERPHILRRKSTCKPLDSERTMRSAPDSRRPPQGVYVGIEFEPMGESPCFAIYVHDGFYGMDYTVQMLDPNNVTPHFVEKSSFQLREKGEMDGDTSGSSSGKSTPEGEEERIDPHVLKRMETAIITWLRDYAASHHVRIMAAGIGIEGGSASASGPARRLSSGGSGQLRICMRDVSLGNIRLHTRLWFELDILPIIVETVGASIDERACSAARKAEMLVIQPGNIPRVSVGFKHQVEVDGAGKIRMVDMEDYERTVSDETWRILMKLAERTKSQRLKFAFFNSTPQGGGVALMRHAIIRLFKLIGVDAHWYVMKPNPEIFDITKRKFHNVLQGVAKGDAHLTDEDKEIYEWWCKDNLLRYWKVIVAESDVIIIDDPQPCAMIPLMKKLNPNLKIIYRSHIEIRSDLVKDKTTEQHHVWSYLWSFIQHADAFISHPVASFVPDMVPKEKLAMMPATTDLLDGLNKKLDEASVRYYHCVFNRTAQDATGKKADFDNRPYIAQIARFDPSKGIPDVVRAYAKLRSRLDPSLPPSQVPQLIIAGHGSIDDPDGNLVFEQVLSLLEEQEFQSIASDVIAARLPPSDQLLNTLLRGAMVAMQLSIREGFEIKVTEALAKGVPVIAYASGGIPHQIQHGRTGFLVKTGDVDTAADRLFDLVTDKELRETMGKSAVECVGEEYFTVFQAVSWLWLINAMHSDTFKGSSIPPPAQQNGHGAIVEESEKHGTNGHATDGVVDRESVEAIEAEFEKTRRKMGGDGRWIKEFWKEEFEGK
ncbi:hypothetical protein HDV00_011955 [Rhizophlyctis rosea]|nr:hypothetical protein HDV00_011955 [Rhizophlyctis rosea]